MATHAMIDLETLHTTPGATVLSVGGVKFNPYTSDEPYDEFYYKLDIDSQYRQVSEATINWWAQQDPKAQEEAFSEEGRIAMDTFIDTLPKWMNGVDVLWGHGYGFDITILEDMLRQCSKPIPWQFWQVRDSRTLFACCKTDPRKILGQADLHNALADSYFQARGVQLAYKELGITH